MGAVFRSRIELLSSGAYEVLLRGLVQDNGGV